MTRHAAAYLRRSSVSADSPGDASEDAQRSSTRRLAAAFAPDSPIVEYRDWGVSGRKDDRPGYVQLKSDIAAGHLCCVFAYSLSRLGRTARELDTLFALCEANDVQVITDKDGTLTATSATGKFLRRILAELAELESELAKERSASARAAKEERGDIFGQPRYGYRHERNSDGRIVEVRIAEIDLQPVLDAYREAGSVLGAVKLLNARGVASPRGRQWGTSALTRVIEKEAPEMLPARTVAGRRQPSSAVLSGLLACHCGSLLTPNVARAQYYCAAGHRSGTAAHGRYSVTERALLPWAKAEAARLRVPGDKAAMGERDDEEREKLIEQRQRLALAFTRGGLDEATYVAEDGRLKGELAKLDARGKLVDIPTRVDWESWEPSNINAVLRSLWRYVQLGPDLLPVSADWHVPEWRAD